MKQFLIILGLIFTTLISNAQFSSLEVRSPDSLEFFLMIRGDQVNEQAASIVRSDSIQHGSLPVDVLFADSMTHISSSLRIDKSKAYTYEILKVAGEYTLLKFAESDLALGLEEDSLVLVDEELVISSDSLPLDSNIVLYDGPKGCNSPLGSAQFNAMLSELEQEFFERNRIKSIDRIVNAHCLRVEQFATLLETIELEDYRIELIGKHKSRLFDQVNMNELKGVFQLEKSKEQFKELMK